MARMGIKQKRIHQTADSHGDHYPLQHISFLRFEFERSKKLRDKERQKEQQPEESRLHTDQKILIVRIIGYLGIAP